MFSPNGLRVLSVPRKSGWMAGIALAIVSSGALAVIPEDAVHGTGPQSTYDRICGYCHGHNIGPVLKGRNLPPEHIEFMVRRGMGAMPAFKVTNISDEELKALAEWISTSQADPADFGR